MRSHIELVTEANIARGMDPDAARNAALRAFGNLTRMSERAYEVRSGGGLETMWQDLRFGVRTLFRNPGFAAVAILTRALGTGATSAIFSFVYAVRSGRSSLPRPCSPAGSRPDGRHAWIRLQPSARSEPDDTLHSALNALTGSMRLARRAGT